MMLNHTPKKPKFSRKHTSLHPEPCCLVLSPFSQRSRFREDARLFSGLQVHHVTYIGLSSKYFHHLSECVSQLGSTVNQSKRHPFGHEVFDCLCCQLCAIFGHSLELPFESLDQARICSQSLQSFLGVLVTSRWQWFMFLEVFQMKVWDLSMEFVGLGSMPNKVLPRTAGLVLSLTMFSAAKVLVATRGIFLQPQDTGLTGHLVLFPMSSWVAMIRTSMWVGIA